MKVSPYEYHNNKLGVKITYLISDRNFNAESIRVISYNALHKRMKSKTCSEEQIREGSWSYDSLVLFSSLEENWRNQITMKFGSPQTEVKKSWFSTLFELDRKAGDFFAAYRYGNDDRRLPNDLIETYIYNASVLNTVIKHKANRKAYAKALGYTRIDIWESLSKDVNAFSDVAHKLPTTSRALRTQVTNYLNFGYAAIISGRLQNQNATKIRDNEQIALIDELLAQHQNFDNAQVANIYNVVAKRMNWDTITPQTIANRKESSNLVIMAGRKGVNALSNTMLMQNKRTAPTNPMLYWTMDGWDAELLYQSTSINKAGHSTTTYHNRLTVVMILDPFNKYPVGYAIGTHETPELIKSALRNAIQHTKELFGAYFRPYQLQTDNYGRGTLKPIYEACSVHYTPAKVKNAKAKVIEPFFNRFNKEYCQMFPNWSGHNMASGSNSQPNSEYLNKIKNQFPDEYGCRQQLISAIEADRTKKQEAYINQWVNVPSEYKSEMSFELYLKTLGETTGYTNRLNGPGLIAKLLGQELCYDSFDINFRKMAHIDWCIKYDPTDLSKVLVVNADSKNGKLVQEVGTYQFILEQKYIQPMALAERSEGDALKLEGVKNYNNSIINFITNEREENAALVENLMQRPELNDTLAKLLLVDSRGQHKDRRNDNRLQEKTKQLAQTQTFNTEAQDHKSLSDEITQFNNQKVNLNDYL